MTFMFPDKILYFVKNVKDSFPQCVKFLYRHITSSLVKALPCSRLAKLVVRKNVNDAYDDYNIVKNTKPSVVQKPRKKKKKYFFFFLTFNTKNVL